MNTWLDELTFAMGSGIRKDLHPQNVDVVEAMTIFAASMLPELQGGTLPRELAIQCRFLADCIAFYRPEFARVRSALQVSKPFGRHMVGPISETSKKAFDAYLKERHFTYIDCPPGAFVIGGDVEVQAVFLKSAIIVDTSREAPSDTEVRVDAIVGRHGVPAMQWLGWTLGQPGTLVARAPREESLFPPTPPPLALLHSIGGRVEDVRALVERAMVNVVVHAKAHEGTPSAQPLPRLQAGDVARRKRTPHKVKTLFDVRRLGLPGEEGDEGG